MLTFAWFAQFAHTVVISPFHSGKTFILNQLVGWNSFRNFTLQNHYNDEKTYISHCGALCPHHGSRHLHQIHCGQRCHRRRVGVIPEAPVIYLRNMSNIVLGRAWSPSLHRHHCRSGNSYIDSIYPLPLGEISLWHFQTGKRKKIMVMLMLPRSNGSKAMG